jgi:hypothetical protein
MTVTMDTEEIPEEEFWDLVRDVRPKYRDPESNASYPIVQAKGIEGSYEEKVENAPVRHDLLDGKPEPEYLLIRDQDGDDDFALLCPEENVEAILELWDYDRVIKKT